MSRVQKILKFLNEQSDRYGSALGNSYETLNDASVIDDGFSVGDTEIWYFKGFSENVNYSEKYLESTHEYLGSIKETDPEQIFTMMQGDVWSPNGEASNLIKSKRLMHTSMSVGDVITSGDQYLICRNIGWSILPKTKYVPISDDVKKQLSDIYVQIKKEKDDKQISNLFESLYELIINIVDFKFVNLTSKYDQYIDYVNDFTGVYETYVKPIFKLDSVWSLFQNSSYGKKNKDSLNILQNISNRLMSIVATKTWEEQQQAIKQINKELAKFKTVFVLGSKNGALN